MQQDYSPDIPRPGRPVFRFYEHVLLQPDTPVVNVLTAVTVPSGATHLSACAHVFLRSVTHEVTGLLSVGANLLLFIGGESSLKAYDADSKPLSCVSSIIYFTTLVSKTWKAAVVMR